MRGNRWTIVLLIVALSLVSGIAFAQTEQKLTLSGVSYTKWLWGNQRHDGSLYNFTTVPGEGYGDNGQGTELELLVQGKPNRYIEVSGRIHSRFSQNFWTNFGGFGGTNPATTDPPPGSCTGGDCGEYDPRSNQYVKLRGLTMRITPGYQYVDAITFGATDLGMFDPFTIGKIRYIDRDNTGAIFVQGKLGDLRYDLGRISLPRLWAGPDFNTGQFASQDGAYALQVKYEGSNFDVGFIGERVRDVEIDASDRNIDNGRSLVNRFSNDVYGIKFGFRPFDVLDVRAAYYDSSSDASPTLSPGSFFGISGFSPVPAGEHEDQTYKVNLDLNDPFGVGLSFNLEYFNIGAEYVSILAARREADVLLTEGRDATFAFPGPVNTAFGVFGNADVPRIGYAGWQGNAQQVATINVDNEFTDFDEPLAESVIGWKGFTIVPVYKTGNLELAAEYTVVDYNTNWQAWGDASRPIMSSLYPNMDSDTGVFRSFRNAYSPFQEREMDIALVRGKWTVDVAKGIDLFGKIKFINEEDLRLNDPRFLPYQGGDCPGGGQACADQRRFYSPGNSTADLYGNPPVITVNGVTGYKWKPFDSISDDDRDLDYTMFQIGAGYQFTDVIYSSLSYEFYDVDLNDGNTAFQAYQLHEMASGKHEKNKVILAVRFPIGGTEAGLNYEYAFGEFTPDFGGGFVPQIADDAQSQRFHVPVGSLGFEGRFGGWNSLEKREFDQQHLKAYFKVRF